MRDSFDRTKSFNDVKKEALEDRLATKMEQYWRLNQQLITAIETDQIVILEKKIENVEIDITELQKQIYEIGAENQINETVRDRNWEVNLHKINYKEISSTVNNIFSKIQNGGTALFLLQDYQMKGGKWCVTLIKDALSQMGRVRPYQIEFLPHQVLNENALLFQLGNYLNIDNSIIDPQHHTDTIIDKICNLLQIGNTIFIELRFPFIELGFSDNLSEDGNFLFWFVSEFWQPLVRKIHDLIEERPAIRLVFLISSNAVLPSSHIYSLTCSEDEFDPEKILELQLENWREDEIKDWLYNFSSLNLDRTGFDRMARSIYQTTTYGLPLAVYSSLLDNFEANYFKE